MKFKVLKDYIYYEGQCNEQKLKKGTIVTFSNSYSSGKCWVKFNKTKYLVNSEDLQRI